MSSSREAKSCRTLSPPISSLLRQGVAIPACPLALDERRLLDERYQRGLLRYYSAAGAGGVAIGVHGTQFAIREPKFGLFRPLLELAAEEMNRLDMGRPSPLVRIGGVCGETVQAVHEVELLQELQYHAALVSLTAFKGKSVEAMVDHCRQLSSVLPIVGFYLQPSVGGCDLPWQFWQGLLEIDNLVAIKMAPFDRYKTLEVLRAVAASGRTDIALYTGNDDHIIVDLLTTFRFGERPQDALRIVGGLLGQWAVWTKRAVELLTHCQHVAANRASIPPSLLQLNAELTDANGAIFDARHRFAGCIPGIHEILRRQGLLRGIWCLDPAERLSPGQLEEIDRVWQMYPQLRDDEFVRTHLDHWLSN